MSPVASSLPPSHLSDAVSAGVEWAPLAIIDISGWESFSPEREREVARNLLEAATKVGFFVVTGHGIEKEEIDKAYAL
ncbi:hypothetical protein HDU93_010072, partial [Gonapodya sp. JEL0774]